MSEGDDSDDQEGDGKQRMPGPCPAASLSGERLEELVDAREDDDDAEEDRDRRDGTPVEAEDDDREQQPAHSDHEEQPPVTGCRSEAAFYVDVVQGGGLSRL